MYVLSAGLFSGSLIYVVCVIALVVVLAALVAWVIRAVLDKTQAEDVPDVLVGLSQVIGALSCFLPWGKWRNTAGEAVPAGEPAQPSGAGAVAPQPSTINLTAGQVAVVREALTELRPDTVQLPMAGERGQQ
ncbi:hypothetical protein [Streptomyces sp. NBC_01304]|uniref:hypothetical protein n=1 Tax=Streptomyces sp. NBC_01304 TaxID=2903818 RepID=UPI002E0EBCAF|nr:hypothetical protein OG430_00065 [Streptomyces sp. NBC_01304]WSJ90884.1 hypothetical protein OG430_47445 [Streptomyces sp. NBC_01304]